MTVKHIVMAGGAYNGIYSIGALKHLIEKKFFDIDNIKSIYGTSVGGFIGALLCLKIDWSIIIDYILDRPWERDLTFSADMMFNMIPNKGILNSDYMKIFFKNLLKSKNLSGEITLKELYDFSKIKLFMFAVDVNTFEVIKISYETHPTLKLIDAVFITCSMPFVFQPTFLNDTYLVDGGVLCNYPLDYCIEDGAKKTEIMGIQFVLNKDTRKYIDEYTNIVYYGYYMFDNLIDVARKPPKNNIENEIIIPCDRINIPRAVEIIKNKEVRANYIKKGEECAKLFLLYVSKEQCSKN
jgi:predicted acylesterase/phospholipase RssA